MCDNVEVKDLDIQELNKQMDMIIEYVSRQKTYLADKEKDDEEWKQIAEEWRNTSLRTRTRKNKKIVQDIFTDMPELKKFSWKLTLPTLFTKNITIMQCMNVFVRLMFICLVLSCFFIFCIELDSFIVHLCERF